MVSGKKRLELSLQNIFDAYRQRFDIEHFFRFGKNKLLMDKSQTPDVEHEEAWWQINMIAYVQLYLARDLAKNAPKPWEKYLETFKSSSSKISPTQVQKDFGRIIQTFGTPALPPKRLKNAPGRQKGKKTNSTNEIFGRAKIKNSATDRGSCIKIRFILGIFKNYTVPLRR